MVQKHLFGVLGTAVWETQIQIETQLCLRRVENQRVFKGKKGGSLYRLFGKNYIWCWQTETILFYVIGC